MLKVGILGFGNAGNQVVAAAYAAQRQFKLYAINSSESDLNTLPDAIPKKLIGDGRGAGKNRDDSKEFLAKDIQNVISSPEMKEFLGDLDLLFVVSSTGGGTGSGGSLLLTQILKSVYPRKFVIPIGIVSATKEALSTHANSLEYLDELYTKMPNQTYMLYDNDKFSSLPTNVMMEKINNAIVNDIIILSGEYNYSTKYASIDDNDMLNLIKTPGRIVIASIPEFKEKDLDNTTIEKMLLQNLSEGPHVNIQKDRIINRIGVIANINSYISEQFDTSATGLQDTVGVPVENFEHLSINDDKKLPNSVYLILTGCSKVNDRVRRINDRVDEILELQKKNEEDDDALSLFNGAELNAKRSYANKDAVANEKVDITGILSAFNVKI